MAATMRPFAGFLCDGRHRRVRQCDISHLDPYPPVIAGQTAPCWEGVKTSYPLMAGREVRIQSVAYLESVAMRNAFGLVLASIVAAVAIAGVWYWTSAPHAGAAPPQTMAAKPA